MLYSIRDIANSFSELSCMRNNEKLFIYDDFIAFAYIYIDKYSLLEKNGELYVYSFYVDQLIQDYKNTL
jgi:hypothetical protein